MDFKTAIPLGQLLVDRGVISEEQLQKALRRQKETGTLLGITLMELGYISEETMFLPIVAGQWGVDFVNLKEIKIPSSTLSYIPAKLASHYKVIPFEYKNGFLKIATTEPLNIHLMDEIDSAVQIPVKPVLATAKDIAEAIREYYGVGAETIDAMMTSVESLNASDSEVQDIAASAEEASIAKFLNQILLEAFRDRATDIHIEPFEDELLIRYRVDGTLCDAKVPSNIKHFKDSINLRIKVLSNLNIAEKRMPQDGRFKVKVGNVEIDLRVSFLPTPYGESVVLRILNSARLYDFKELGLNAQEQKILEDLIKRPHGIVFLTGPTGSGKTTTLYSCLSRINTEDKKVITIEDPIEYQLKGITQIQVNPLIGLTFAHGLRSMLRHDPDIMMVGEVRDIETAEIAIQVALTGHLVFSTLHTNDAASGVARLLDMGVDPYLVTSTVDCFIAQRLIRLLCPKCKQPSKITEEVIKELDGQVHIDPSLKVFEPKGCEACKMTGYFGRHSIYEFLLIDDTISALIMKRVTSNEIKELAVKKGMKTLRQSGWEKVQQGLTTPQEVLRVTREEKQ